MASVTSQLIEEVTAHAQSDSLEDAREICADGTYFPNNVGSWLHLKKKTIYFFPVPSLFSNLCHHSACSYPCHLYDCHLLVPRSPLWTAHRPCTDPRIARTTPHPPHARVYLKTCTGLLPPHKAYCPMISSPQFAHVEVLNREGKSLT